MKQTFDELLEKYWSVAFKQGTEGRHHDDATGAAEGAEWDLRQYVADLAKDRDYWKTEAEGERAKVEFRDKMIEKLQRPKDFNYEADLARYATMQESKK